MPRNALRVSVIFLAAVTLAACGGKKSTRDGPGSSRVSQLPGDAVPRQEPRSRYGNGPVYEVFGKRYTVMPSSSGYQERGVASWYGKKFHGNMTSNREVYDMYGMTAAHKSLPLPTYVRVRNLRNNKTIVVRVNDRGPFVGNRIIDLSYSAALKLDMVKAGTGLVEVTAINVDTPSAIAAEPRPQPRPIEPPAQQAPPVLRSVPSVTEDVSTVDGPNIYAQVGAFGERANADRRLMSLTEAGISGGFVHKDQDTSTTLFRVRIGPVADVAAYDTLVEELSALGINDPYLISE